MSASISSASDKPYTSVGVSPENSTISPNGSPQEGYKSQSAGPILSHHKTEIAAARRESPFQGMVRAAIQTSQGFYQSAPESHAPLLKDTPASFEAQNG